jgi:hypothetical protein
MFAHSLLDQDDVVQCGDDCEEEGCAQEDRTGNPDSAHRVNLQQEDKEHRTDL